MWVAVRLPQVGLPGQAFEQAEALARFCLHTLQQHQAEHEYQLADGVGEAEFLVGGLTQQSTLILPKQPLTL